MITAQQAKQLSDDCKRSSSYVFDAIKAMAEAGRNYAIFEKSRIGDLSEVKTLATDSGFSIEESGDYLTIKW